MAEHNITGKKGEEMALEYLLSKGFSIIEKNWIYKKFEIDIIAQQNKTLVVAEVKTRSGNYFGEPEAWVTRIKQKQLVKGAEAYVLQKKLDLEVRFDIITVLFSIKGEPKIQHIEDAFYPLV
ncbi:MAG: YraN family protein [Bacteroidetes bacterium]|nr:YraN family protein [Bacteroidota bacterium]HET6242922.1 YraN family protein [Bacteroidia bacterium]